MLYTVFKAASLFLYIIRIAILVYCVMSWFRPTNRFFYLLARFIAPFVMPFRRFSMWLMSKTNLPVDFSCLFAIIGLSLADRLLWLIFSLLVRVP